MHRLSVNITACVACKNYAGVIHFTNFLSVTTKFKYLQYNHDSTMTNLGTLPKILSTRTPCQIIITFPPDFNSWLFFKIMNNLHIFSEKQC